MKLLTQNTVNENQQWWSSDTQQKTQCEDGDSRNGEKCVCDSSKKCCGIKLNTNVPFIGNCITLQSDSIVGENLSWTTVTPITAFPVLTAGLSKILLTAILVISFALIVVGGVMMTTGGADSGNYSTGKNLITKVARWLALLWASGVILRLINPNFFG